MYYLTVPVCQQFRSSLAEFWHGVSQGCSQDTSQSCSRPKVCLGLEELLAKRFVHMADKLEMAVGRKRHLLTRWASQRFTYIVLTTKLPPEWTLQENEVEAAVSFTS